MFKSHHHLLDVRAVLPDDYNIPLHGQSLNYARTHVFVGVCSVTRAHASGLYLCEIRFG